MNCLLPRLVDSYSKHIVLFRDDFLVKVLTLFFLSFLYPSSTQSQLSRHLEAKQKKTNASQPSSTKPSRPTKSPKKPSAATLPLPGPVSQLRQDLEGLNLIPSSSSSSSSVIGSGVGKKGKNTIDDDVELPLTPPTPTINISKEKILEEVRRREADEKPVLSLVVVGSFKTQSRFYKLSCVNAPFF